MARKKSDIGTPPIKRATKGAAIASATILIGILLGGLSPLQAQSPRTWSALYSQGEKAINNQKPGLAEKYLRKAIELAKEQPGDGEALDKCQLKLATALTLLDRTTEARSITRKVFARQEKRFGSRSQKLEPVLMTLGSIEESAGNHDNAMEYYRKALNLTESTYGAYSPQSVSALHGIGRVHAKQGHMGEARASYRSAISILSRDANSSASKQLDSIIHGYRDLIKKDDNSDKARLDDFDRDILGKQQNNDVSPSNEGTTGPSSSNSQKNETRSTRLAPSTVPTSHPTERFTSTTSNNSVKFPMFSSSPQTNDVTGGPQSQWQRESQSNNRTLRRSETDEDSSVVLRGFRQPSSSSTLAPAYRVMNESIFDQTRYRGTEEQQKRMISTDIDSLGPNHPSVANDLTGLAQLYISQGRYSEAEPLLEKALNIYLKTYGDDNQLAINTKTLLASTEFQLGKMDRAAQLYNSALDSARAILGPNSLETAKILNGLAYLYFTRGEMDKSQTYYEWAVSSTEKAVGDRDPLLAACLSDYAQVLRRLGKSEKASDVELRAKRILASNQSS